MKMSDGNAVHYCQLGTRATHKLRVVIKLDVLIAAMQVCTHQQLLYVKAVCPPKESHEVNLLVSCIEALPS